MTDEYYRDFAALDGFIELLMTDNSLTQEQERWRDKLKKIRDEAKPNATEINKTVRKFTGDLMARDPNAPAKYLISSALDALTQTKAFLDTLDPDLNRIILAMRQSIADSGGGGSGSSYWPSSYVSSSSSSSSAIP